MQSDHFSRRDRDFGTRKERRDLVELQTSSGGVTLSRNKLSYRFLKIFSGAIIHDHNAGITQHRPSLRCYKVRENTKKHYSKTRATVVSISRGGESALNNIVNVFRKSSFSQIDC